MVQQKEDGWFLLRELKRAGRCYESGCCDFGTSLLFPKKDGGHGPGAVAHFRRAALAQYSPPRSLVGERSRLPRSPHPCAHSPALRTPRRRVPSPEWLPDAQARRLLMLSQGRRRRQARLRTVKRALSASSESSRRCALITRTGAAHEQGPGGAGDHPAHYIYARHEEITPLRNYGKKSVLVP